MSSRNAMNTVMGISSNTFRTGSNSESGQEYVDFRCYIVHNFAEIYEYVFAACLRVRAVAF